MRFYEKKAEDLQPGDYLANGSMVVFVKLQDFAMAEVVLSDNYIIHVNSVHRTMMFDMRAKDEPKQEPELTPAQLHAEELLDFVERVAFIGNHHALPEEAHTLLEKIKPPEPPTLEEALQSLSLVMRSDVHDAVLYREYADAACRILTRARRAGLLP